MNSAVFATYVSGLPCVFFKMGAFDTYSGAVGKVKRAIDTYGLVVLADLIILGHVGIKIVFSVKNRRPNIATQCYANSHR